MNCNIETYKDLAYIAKNLATDEPYVWNGELFIKRHRVIIEEIEESREVIIEKLEKMYRECDNHHNVAPIRAEAKRLKHTLKSEYGCERKIQY